MRRDLPPCERVEEAISARLDGEDPVLDDDLLSEHLAGCAACRAFEATSATLHRAVSVRSAPEVRDRTREILAAVRAIDRAPAWLAVRAVLAVVAVAEAVLIMPALVYGDDGGVPTHAARHLGAFGVAFAVALLVIAFRPQQARSLVPMTATLAAGMIAGAIIDSAEGNTSPFLEGHHLLEVFGLVLVWLLAVPASWPRRDRDRAGRRGTARRAALRLAATPVPNTDHSETNTA